MAKTNTEKKIPIKMASMVPRAAISSPYLQLTLSLNDSNLLVSLQVNPTSYSAYQGSHFLRKQILMALWNPALQLKQGIR